jgi:hypothetical protein
MRQLIPHPPPLQDLGLKRDVRIRFVTNSAFSGSITYQNLLDIFNVAASAITAFDLFTAVKIRSVEIWANGLTNSAVTATVTFDAGVGIPGDTKVHTDSSMGIEPAHVLARPARMSLPALFQSSSNAVAFQLTVPVGAVVDLSLSLRNPLTASAVATQAAPAGALAGATYVRGMDGLPVATSKFTAQGFSALD